MLERLRRCLCTVLLLTLVGGSAAFPESALRGYDAGDGYVYVTLGRYPQQADGGVEPILWRVLQADEERIWLLSEYILFARAMHTSLGEYQKSFQGDFAQTELCGYLNSTFASDAFTENEQALLMPFEPYGRVFLLSREELNDTGLGLGVTLRDSKSGSRIRQNPGIRAWGTAWATENNGYAVEDFPNPKEKIRNAADTANITVAEKRLFVYSAERGGASPYWTRSQSASDGRHANCTKADGGIGHIEVGRDNEGVRPSVFLKPDGWQILSGTGTKDDPFVMAVNAAETGEEE